MREHKKVNAGAQFFQTNLVYDLERMEIWLNELAKRNILDKVYIMIGITPLKSAKMTHYMTEVPGVYVPEDDHRTHGSRRCKGGNAQEEGVQIALELIEKIQRQAGYPRPAHHAGWLGRHRPAHRHRSWPAAEGICPT